MAKYIIAISTLNEERLSDDKIHLPDLPDILNTLTENLSPSGALDLEGLYLVNDAQKTLLFELLNAQHLPFPVDVVAPCLDNVVHLHDRRRRTEGPDGSRP